MKDELRFAEEKIRRDMLRWIVVGIVTLVVACACFTPSTYRLYKEQLEIVALREQLAHQFLSSHDWKETVSTAKELAVSLKKHSVLFVVSTESSFSSFLKAMYEGKSLYNESDRYSYMSRDFPVYAWYTAEVALNNSEGLASATAAGLTVGVNQNDLAAFASNFLASAKGI